jgi:glycosyltransferase involved in cell wall biosynthesis
MGELRIPAGVEWELLVVNNNSPDDTDTVIERHRAIGKLPIQRLFEPKQGLSNARNCAVAAARGDLIIWTDDDVLVDPQWLQAYVDAFYRFPNAAFFGGVIRPWYEKPPPQWVERNQKHLFGMLILRDISEPEGISESVFFGANMAFRSDVFKRYRFDAALGVKGQVRLSGEETELMNSLRASGSKGVWVPGAIVHHYTPAHRMTLSYTWRYYVGYGRSIVRIEGLGKCSTLFGVPRFLFRVFAKRLFQTGMAVLRQRNSWLLPFLEAAKTMGMIVEARSQAHEVLAGIDVSRSNRKPENAPATMDWSGSSRCEAVQKEDIPTVTRQ